MQGIKEYLSFMISVDTILLYEKEGQAHDDVQKSHDYDLVFDPIRTKVLPVD